MCAEDCSAALVRSSARRRCLWGPDAQHEIAARSGQVHDGEERGTHGRERAGAAETARRQVDSGPYPLRPEVREAPRGQDLVRCGRRQGLHRDGECAAAGGIERARELANQALRRRRELRGGEKIAFMRIPSDLRKAESFRMTRFTGILLKRPSLS